VLFRSYWPRKYLIDAEGFIRYDHIGEGGYVETENAIRNLLAERVGQQNISLAAFNQTNQSISRSQSVDFNQINTPELYFGYLYARSEIGNSEGFQPDKIASYSLPSSMLKPNIIYLEGKWKNNADSMDLVGNEGKIVLHYSAKSINIVAGGKGDITVKEFRKDNQTGSPYRGNDLDNEGKLTIDGQRLYNIGNNQEYGNHQVQIDASGPGFKIYTFTFG